MTGLLMVMVAIFVGAFLMYLGNPDLPEDQ